MPTLSPEQWRAVSPYLDQALEFSPEQRASWLESLRQQNPALATDLQTLLREHDALGDERFLQTAAAFPTPGPLTGQTVGAYTLETPIGHGGMGTVWLARRSDGRFQGRAAVKFLNVALVGGAVEERFKREGSILARLAHPNIAHLIDAGVSPNGQPYLILEYIEGNQVDKYCNERALDLEARIHLFLDVLAAVAHAHANLIVHRDIKPSNVLVTNGGQVKLLDFGIAKLLEDETGMAAATILTREGERALTLAYAAPEQVSGNAVTTGTDVYALGVLLYLLLAGKHPAEAALQSPADLMKAIVDTEPPRASASVGPTHKLSRVLRGDLDTIVAKALKKNPAERYVLVTVFAEDLRRYLGHQVISARPDTLAYRARKFVRRNQMAVALAAAASVAMVSGVVSTVIQARNARIERDFALRQLSRAESINDLNSFVLSDAAPSGKPFSVNDLLTRAEELVGRQKGGDEVNRIELLVSIGSQYISHNEYTQARRVLEQAYALARALPQGPTRARTSCALADSLVLDSDRERAEQLVQEGLSELPRDARFALDRVFCLRRASDVAFRGGQFQEAIARAEGAQRALSEMPFRAEVSELDNLIVLANLYLHGGRVREASALFEEVSARLTSLGRDKTQRTGDLFTNWGLALSIWGRPLDAERFLRQAIALGQDNQTEGAVLPSVLLYYAQALKELGKFDEASDYAGRAGTKAQAAGMPGVLVQSLLVRSAVHRHQGDLERANQMVSDAESVLQSNSPARAKSIATLSQRALIAQARGDMQTALELATEAVTTAEAARKQGRAVSDELQGLLVNRSAIQLQLGHPDDAAEDARRALKMSPHAAEPAVFSSTVGRAQVALGRALQAQERREEARSAFRSALEHLQSALGPDHAETRAARQLVDRQIPL